MSKKLVTSYTFTASAKTIVSADFTSLEKIQLITNVTRNIIIYNFASPTLGGTLAGTTLTLTYNTAAVMADADKLQIFVEDATVTVPVSNASLPLPTGAATSAKQPALGTAGTASADVLTVQGKTSMTPLLVDPSGVTSPVSLATVPSHAVTNIGTFAVQATLAAETTKVIGTVNQGTSPWVTSNATTSVVGNGTAATAQRVSLASDSTGQVTLATGANTIGALTANQSVNNAQVNGVAVSTGNGISGTGVQRVTLASDGTGVVGLATGSNTIGALTANQSTNVSQMNGTTVTMGNGVAGTGVQRVTLASDSTGQVTIASGTVTTVSTLTGGGVASGSADSGNPVKTGGQARTTNPTAAADANRANFITDKLGKQVVVGSIRDLKANQQTTITASTAETTIVTAVASTFCDLYGLILTNSSATATSVTIKDSTAGTTQAVIMVPAGDTRGFMLNESAAMKQTTVNTAWTATSSQSVTSLFVSAFYVKNI